MSHTLVSGSSGHPRNGVSPAVLQSHSHMGPWVAGTLVLTPAASAALERHNQILNTWRAACGVPQDLGGSVPTQLLPGSAGLAGPLLTGSLGIPRSHSMTRMRQDQDKVQSPPGSPCCCFHKKEIPHMMWMCPVCPPQPCPRRGQTNPGCAGEGISDVSCLQQILIPTELNWGFHRITG